MYCRTLFRPYSWVVNPWFYPKTFDHTSSVISKKTPNVYKSCPKMIPLENERL